jgi:feruloyl esterase
MTTDFDTLAASIFGSNADFPVSNTELLNMDDAKLAFKNGGGKLIVYAGQTGGPFSPQDLVNWYAETNTSHGGTAQNFAPTQSFARLFMVPGMNHCSGGPATSTFDSFTPVVNWVENGVAPASIPATAPAAGTPFPGRTRPLCPYPTYARYNGSGDINVASNFSCQM